MPLYRRATGNATEKIDLGQLNPVLWEFTCTVCNFPYWLHHKVLAKSKDRTPVDAME
jgi:hypothetical protein